MRSIILLTIVTTVLAPAVFGDNDDYSPDELAAIERVKEECEKAGYSEAESELISDACYVTAKYQNIILYDKPATTAIGKWKYKDKYGGEIVEDIDANVVGTIKKGDEAIITNGLSLLSDAQYDPRMRSGLTEYITWFQVDYKGIYGWCRIVRTNTLIRFEKDVINIREGPSIGDAVIPVDKREFRYDYRGDWKNNPVITSGEIRYLMGYFDGWFCVGNGYEGGWLPVTTPGVEVFSPCVSEGREGYTLTAKRYGEDRKGYYFFETGLEEIYYDDEDYISYYRPIPCLTASTDRFFVDTDGLVYYLPIADTVNRVYYCEPQSREHMGFNYISEPELTVTTENREYRLEYVGESHPVWHFVFHEFVSTEDIITKDITTINMTTLSEYIEIEGKTVLDPDSRIKVTLDWYAE